MSEVIDFLTKDVLITETILTEDNLATRVLKELLKDSNNIQDILIFIKDNDDNIGLFHTGIDIKDRSHIVQLLTSDIQQELASTEDLFLEEDI